MTLTSKYINEAVYTDLIDRYNKTTLNKRELSNELGISVSSINSYIVKGYGIPEYTKIGCAKNATVLFPIICVAEFLSRTIKVAA